jgi:hypothetical protein
MTRSKSAAAWAMVGMLGLTILPAAQAMDFAQAMGFGYGPGYNAPGQSGHNGSGQSGCQSCNAPAQSGYQNCNAPAQSGCQTCIPGGMGYRQAAPFCSAQLGCCEIPANWRQHVWNGYRGDPCTWHTSYCGVPKPPGYGYGYGKGGCPNCQPCATQPQLGSAYATPVSAQQPIPSTTRAVQY